MAKLNLILIFSVAITLTNCATTNFVVGVDAYGDDSRLERKTYVLASGDSTLNENSLQFIEFSNYIRKILHNKGYIETTNSNNADLVIFFRYGISDPQTFQETYSIPVYGQTGISSMKTTSYTTGSAYGSAYGYGNTVYGSAYGSSYKNSVTNVTPTYGVTGYRQETNTYVSYFRYLTLNAYDMKYSKPKMEWSIALTSSGSSDDLRRVIPYMLAVGEPYFGKNSDKKLTLKILENDVRVKRLKGIE